MPIMTENRPMKTASRCLNGDFGKESKVTPSLRKRHVDGNQQGHDGKDDRQDRAGHVADDERSRKNSRSQRKTPSLEHYGFETAALVM